MKVIDSVATELVVEAVEQSEGTELLRPLVDGRASKSLTNAVPTAVLVGTLVGLAEEGQVPLVIYEGQPGTAALAARSVVDLHGAHIGKPVVLLLEANDPSRPIVMGVVRQGVAWPSNSAAGRVDVDADGERLIVAAKEQVVLRCGKASITLTKSGKVRIEGTYVVTHSSGVNRIKGGAVRIN